VIACRSLSAIDQRAARREHGLAALLANATIRVPHANLTPGNWRLEDSRTTLLLRRIEGQCVPLEKYLGCSPLFGIKTGFNQAYCIDDNTRERLVRSDPASSEFIRRFVRGRDIGRWKCKEAGQWFIVLPSSSNRDWPWARVSDVQAAFRIFEENYPALAEHLRQYEEQLTGRSDQGRFWWELRSCDYYATFDQSKILVGTVAWRAEFSLDDDGLYVSDTTYVIPGRDLYLLAILNSRLMWWYFYLTARPMKDDAREYRGVLPRLPIPRDIASGLRQSIEAHVNQLLSLAAPENVARRGELEISLNQLIEEAYQLTTEERQVILESLAPRDPIALLGAEPQGFERTVALVDVPLMPRVIPSLDPAQEAAICVWSLLHAAGGSISRTDLARAFVLRSQPALLERLAPPDLQASANAWSARVATRSVGAGSLAEALRTLGSRDGLKLTTDASGASLVTASAHTPPEDQIDEWFRFEARLALRVLAAVPAARVQEVDSVIPDADRVVLRSAGVA
jgi:hypothetical protein